MVRGIDKFREYFTEYADNYIVIGGTASDILQENAGLQPRATKDIDIILIVEALSANFVRQFWHFIKDGNYETRQLNEDLSSLSAILMNDDYYHFTLEHSTIEDNIRLANIESLIALKAKAFLDLSERKAADETIDERNIRKHKNDIFRLAIMLTETDKFTLPTDIQNDMNNFCKQISQLLPNDDFFKRMGLAIKPEKVFELLCNAFQIKL